MNTPSTYRVTRRYLDYISVIEPQGFCHRRAASMNEHHHVPHSVPKASCKVSLAAIELVYSTLDVEYRDEGSRARSLHTDTKEPHLPWPRDAASTMADPKSVIRFAILTFNLDFACCASPLTGSIVRSLFTISNPVASMNRSSSLSWRTSWEIRYTCRLTVFT